MEPKFILTVLFLTFLIMVSDTILAYLRRKDVN